MNFNRSAEARKLVRRLTEIMPKYHYLKYEEYFRKVIHKETAVNERHFNMLLNMVEHYEKLS